MNYDDYHQYLAHHGLSRDELPCPVPGFRDEISPVIFLAVLALVGEESLIIGIFRMNGGQKQFGYKGTKLNFSHLLQDIASEHMIPYQGHHHHKPSLTIINEINVIIDDH